MKVGWKKTPLGDVIDIHDSRRIPLSGAQRSQRQGKYPYYGAQSIIDYIDDYIFDGKFLLIAEDGENLRSRKEPIAFFASGKFWVNNHAHIVTAKPELADDYFIKACLNHFNLAAYVTGAAQPKLSQGNLRQIEIALPDLPTQRKIAGILSAYDDLIENNLRRIKILEEMAQSLYREWFVHFRFPGHESARFTNSELGQIPKGWEVKPLFDVATVKYGKMLPKKDLADSGPFPVYGAAKVIGRHTSFTCEERTIICGCRGSVGEMQITEPRCYVTNNSFTFDPVSANLYFWLFYTLSERGLRDVTGGAAQPQITLDGISQVFLSVPPDSILGVFEKRSRALAELAWNLKSKNQNLRRTRDLLLPKLLNGTSES